MATAISQHDTTIDRACCTAIGQLASGSYQVGGGSAMLRSASRPRHDHYIGSSSAVFRRTVGSRRTVERSRTGAESLPTGVGGEIRLDGQLGIHQYPAPRWNPGDARFE